MAAKTPKKKHHVLVVLCARRNPSEFPWKRSAKNCTWGRDLWTGHHQLRRNAGATISYTLLIHVRVVAVVVWHAVAAVIRVLVEWPLRTNHVPRRRPRTLLSNLFLLGSPDLQSTAGPGGPLLLSSRVDGMLSLRLRRGRTHVGGRSSRQPDTTARPVHSVRHQESLHQGQRQADEKDHLRHVARERWLTLVVSCFRSCEMGTVCEMETV